jgi:hypothetical protein
MFGFTHAFFFINTPKAFSITPISSMALGTLLTRRSGMATTNYKRRGCGMILLN